MLINIFLEEAKEINLQRQGKLKSTKLKKFPLFLFTINKSRMGKNFYKKSTFLNEAVFFSINFRFDFQLVKKETYPLMLVIKKKKKMFFLISDARAKQSTLKFGFLIIKTYLMYDHIG